VLREAAQVLIIAAVLGGCAKKEGATAAGDTGAMASTVSDTGMAAAPAVAPSTDEGKIANARSAAPDSISRNATVMDWAATEGGKMRQLAAGTNGWTCYPSSPNPKGAVGEDPMCLDPVFQKWAEAWMTKKDPHITAVGFGYMLQGDRGASNTDPFATESTPTNNWVTAGPHVMVVAPGATIAAVSAKPGPTPWIMWKGTAYAHVMMPVK
jgi:hypothetical protein